MTVNNTGFLLDRLGQDCAPLQYVRELTQNSIEAVLRTGVKGHVVWDADWIGHKARGGGPLKLSCIDTGDGMTADHMVQNINRLSASGSEQAMDKNYGVGAKIAALTRNHAGLLYMSWREGKGHLMHAWRDPRTGEYGIRQQVLASGEFAEVLPIGDEAKPELIHTHGTAVVLIGMSDREDTMEPPPGAPSPSRWVARYLNTRYFEFPDGVVVSAREGWRYPKSNSARNTLRRVYGQKRFLEESARSSGVLQMPGGKAHWWILRDADEAHQSSGLFETAGHVAALYQSELYEMQTGRAGSSRLQNFGIIFGARQIVIYVEPEGEKLTTNTARTIVLQHNQPLPWALWADYFREHLPQPIKDFIEEKASAATLKDHSASIRDRLKDLMKFFEFSRFRASPEGGYHVDPNQLTRGGFAAWGEPQPEPDVEVNAEKSEGGTTANAYRLFERKHGEAADKISPDPYPKVRWISRLDGTRDPGQLDDRAAQFLPDSNMLMVNADFRGITDLIDHWAGVYGDHARPMISEVVRGWVEQQLTETVLGVQSLRGGKHWSFIDIVEALSEEALTAAVLPRYHLYNVTKRDLAIKLGKSS
jgi:hypothetical protein